MNEDRYEAAVRSAVRSIVDQASDAPEWHELKPRQPTRTTRPPRPLLAAIGAAFGVLIAFGTVGFFVNSQRLETTSDTAPVASEVPVATTMGTGLQNPTMPSLEVDAPEGVFVITHLWAVVTGRVDPGTQVTVGGEPAIVDESGSGEPLSAIFSREFWLELGDNTVDIAAIGPGGTTTRTLQPVVLPSARTRLGFITEVSSSRIEFDPVETERLDDSPMPVVPPTLSMIGVRSQTDYRIRNSVARSESLWLDSRVSVILSTSTVSGSAYVVVPITVWSAMLSGEEDDSAFDNAVTLLTPYWVTVHDGEVVQIQQQLRP